MVQEIEAVEDGEVKCPYLDCLDRLDDLDNLPYEARIHPYVRARDRGT
jgi:hypothetical protein